MSEQLPKTYNPHQVEEKWYEFWEKEGYFTPEDDEDKTPFTIMMPPPNVTGELHLGHALDSTLQDIIIRWRRMQGYNTLWLPGTDHASIATEVKVVEQIREEGLTKEEIGREKFLERAWDWKDKYGGKITEQIRYLGASCDWTRERFTMDEGCSEAVKEAFVRLYEDGLIYRGDYIVNWCPDCETSLSDLEVEHEEESGKLYYIRYPFADDSGYITVATTRPETMLGDTAVAVDPDDERYQQHTGKTVILPLMERPIPVIKDEFVDSDFGTGMVKVTPAHDPNDFEMGERHDLEKIQVIDYQGFMSAEAGEYVGLSRQECREQVVEDLKEADLLEKVEDHEHAVGHCYRCDEIVEPMISKQWFVEMEPLAEPAIEAVKEGEVNFVPERFERVYMNWMENIEDWCISRQLWWGHRIPVWYCQDCGAENVAREEPESCSECGSENLEQEEDVLDTWFSSGLWPFSTLGWPEETEDLEYFYPTDVLVTGRDIIFFWVARMIFQGIYNMDEPPFSDIYVHGLILASDGRKMSKSLGTGIDPLDIIEDYGADTLRFMLITGSTPGNDRRFREERLEASRNFANKIWNASRFMLMNLEEDTPKSLPEDSENISPASRWMLHRFNEIVDDINTNMEKFLFGEVSQTLYDFIWGEFCDWYLELIKPHLYDAESEEEKQAELRTGQYLLGEILKLLHPVMPFITEEIWQKLPGSEGSIMLQDWPEIREECFDDEAYENMEILQEVIRSIRNIRNEMNVDPGRGIKALFSAGDEYQDILDSGSDYIAELAGVDEIQIAGEFAERPEKAATAVVREIEIILPLEEMIDIDQEITRLEKEKAEVEAEIERARGKLANDDFVEKAPDEIVQEERDKLEEYRQEMEQIKARIEELEG